MGRRKSKYNFIVIVYLLGIILVLCSYEFALAQLDYSVDLGKKAKLEDENKDFLQQREIEAEKKQIKKKMKELLGDRDYKQLLESCERLQQLDPDDKFIDLYKKFAEEGLLKELVKPQLTPSVEKVIIETTPEAIESPEEEIKSAVGKEPAKSELITSVENKKPLFSGNRKFIIIGIIGIIALIGIALIFKGSKKKALKVGEGKAGENLLMAESSFDILSDISKGGAVSDSGIYFPQTESETDSAQIEAGKEPSSEAHLEKQKTDIYSPLTEETERKLSTADEFKLPAFDEVLAEENMGMMESTEKEEPSFSATADKTLRPDEGLPEPLTSSPEQLVLESQEPLYEEMPSETIPLAHNGLPVDIEPLLPIPDEKGVVIGAKDQKSQPQEPDESLNRLDEISGGDLTPSEDLVSLPKESLSEIKEEADRKIKMAGVDLGSAKGGDAKTGFFDELSIDELLSGVVEEEKEEKKKDGFSQAEIFSSEKEKEQKKSEDISGAETLVLASDTDLREEKDDWVLIKPEVDKSSPLDIAKIEEKPISELSKKSEKDIEKSVMSYNEDEDELNIESEILSSPELSTKEIKKSPQETEKKEIESDTDAVFNEHYIMGCKAMTQRNWKKAIYEFNIALAIKPDSSETKEKLNEARRMKTEEGNAP